MLGVISWLVVSGESNPFCFAKYGESIERFPSREIGSSSSHMVLVIFLARLLRSSLLVKSEASNLGEERLGEEGFSGVNELGVQLVDEYVDEKEENEDDEADLCKS